jgi:sugar phosphate isomerase/epimerase
MKLILFAKMFKDHSLEELADLACDWGIDGYDLAVRPDYPVNPDNVGTALDQAVRLFDSRGLSIPMITGNFDLLLPKSPNAEPLVAAMGQAGVGLLKLGYFKYDPATQSYWEEVDRIRRALEGWQAMGEKHGVKICYHTHANRCMGLNAGLLMHMLRGFDPRYIGAYLDTAHLTTEGEEFAVAAAVAGDHFSILSVKDMLLLRGEKNGHGSKFARTVVAGEGMVDWTAVFAELDRIGFDGPLSIHCEFEVPQGEEFVATAAREAAFFRRLLGRA